MRKVTLVFFFLALHSFYPSRAQQVVQRIDFTKSSRGFLEELTITQDSVSIKTENARSSVLRYQRSEKLEEKKWAQIRSVVESLSLAEIPLYKSPTMKRSFDGALHATLTITTAAGDSYTHGFDDENPHPNLRALMKCIQEIRKGVR